MRLSCPNCGAQYEVSLEVIPAAGRDVQCSNCGHTWFQIHPDEDIELAEEVSGSTPDQGWTPEGTNRDEIVARDAAEDPARQPADDEVQPPDMSFDEDTPQDLSQDDTEVQTEDHAEDQAEPDPDDTEAEEAVVPEYDAVEETAEDRSDEAETETEPHVEESSSEDTAEDTSEEEIESEPHPEPDEAPEAEEQEPEEEDSSDDADQYPEDTGEQVGEADDTSDDGPEEDHPTSDDDEAPDDDERPMRRTLDPDVAEVLREEAEYETQAREAESQEALEMQQELGIEENFSGDHQRASEARARMLRIKGLADQDTTKTSDDEAQHSRRELLPDIEEINSTLRATDDRNSSEAATGAVPTVARRRSGFRLGILTMLVVAVLLLLTYAYNREIAKAYPSTEPAMTMFMEKTNGARVWLDTLVTNGMIWLNNKADASSSSLE